MVEPVRFDNDNVGGGAYEDRTVKTSKRHSANSSNKRLDQLSSVQQLEYSRTINDEEPRGDGSNDFSDFNDYYD